MFVDSRYSAEATDALCRKHFPQSTVTAIHMSLREIFLSLARTSRKSTKGSIS